MDRLPPIVKASVWDRACGRYHVNFDFESNEQRETN